MDYDIVVIGAGVVGLACAHALSKLGRVLVIERHPSFGLETSSRNSEVIHAGIYYPQDSLKANLCVKGNRSLYQWCEVNRVPHCRIGKLIVATNSEEEGQLEKILQKAISNDVDSIAKVSNRFIRDEEPNVKASSALLSPNTGIIDSHSLMKSLQEKALINDADFAWRHSVAAIDKKAEGFRIYAEDDDKNSYAIDTKFVINSAGLDSDIIAEKAGIEIDKYKYRLNFCRGHYFRVAHSKSNMVGRLIYPVTADNSPNLGIHLTKELNGEIKLGPDAEFLTKREQIYFVDESLKHKFHKAANAYLPWLKPDDIRPDQSGIRPKLQEPNGVFRDFIISEESDKGLNGMINLIGIESPGLTCCLQIAEMVAQWIK